MHLAADWGTSLVLLAVFLAEGLRRLPADAIVLRRSLRGSWRVVHGPTDRTQWRLVSLWPPFSEHLVLLTGESTDFLRPERRSKKNESGPGLPSSRVIVAFRLAGAWVFLVVAFVVPIATTSFGGAGFASALLVALGSAGAIAIAAAACLRKELGGWRPALSRTRTLLSPFAAPRASELLFQDAVSRWSPSAALGVLVRREDLEQWYRPYAYDALQATHPGRKAGPSTTRLKRIVSRVPADCGPDERFCPRCAAVFRSEVVRCSDCPSVMLLEPAVSLVGGTSSRRSRRTTTA